LRIAMLSVHSCPIGQLGTKDTGGMSVYIRELARELGKLGHRVDLFTRVHDPHDPLMESLARNVRLIHFKVGGDEAINKLDLYHLLPDFISSLDEFRKRRRLKYDLIFSHYWLSGIVGQEIGRWWDVPNIIMFHTLGAIKNTLGIGYEEPELRIKTENELAQSCQRIIAATENEKNTLVHDYSVSADKVAVIPCGVNLKVFRPLDRRSAREKVSFGSEKIVLFAGRIEPLKGIDRLFRAFANIPNKDTIRLIVIGGDTESEVELTQLKQLANKLGITKAIVFTGTVKHELMPYYYNAADVCVVSSHYESFGLVALEALACGTPVVATDVGDLRNIIQPGLSGYVVSNHSVNCLSEMISEVLDWPDRNLSRSRLIRQSVTGFSWENTALQINEEFNRVIEQYHNPAS
jgi:D-inositol-3-phosphate glycosyltransferase